MIERWIHNRIHALPLALLVLLVLDFAGSPVFAEDTAGKSSPESQIDFERDVQPILTRYGCNSGACHGKQRGQNGFQLSLLGFDSDFDHDSLIMESRGRRVTFARPGDSLLLTKASGKVPHGGGVRLPVDSAGYQLLLEWIKAGAPRALPNIPDLVNVTVEPVTHEFQHHEKQQLQVIAHYTDGSTRNVTGLATYQSNESPIADVNAAGEVTAGNLTGKATIMARYADQFALFTANIPQLDRQPAEYYESLPRNNEIDDLVWQNLQQLGLKASAPSEEHRFLRRVYLDIIGRAPTADEARQYLEDPSPLKREYLVDQLLNHPEYAEHWANKWADLLRPNPYHAGIKATRVYDAWIRQSFRKNQPYDEFVRELITAQGSTFRNGNVTLYRDRRKPDELTTIVSQLFLGVRLECAKCHQHPFEVYSQEDFYSFAAYFAKIGRKGTGISAPISGSEEFVFAGTKGEVQHPLTKAVLQPRPLSGDAPDLSSSPDPRVDLANWITSPENDYFCQTMANRIWKDLMGIGLVEPVDDLRATNPASNPALLELLGEKFAAKNFDIKQLIRMIVLSQAYSLSSVPEGGNEIDTRYFSRHYRQRLRGEVLLDTITQITGVPEQFSAMSPESRAKELWTHRIDSLFLDAYGRPDPNQDPPCERIEEPTVVQTLHLMNSRDLYRKITNDTGRAAELAKSELTSAQIVEELYLSIYSRFPTAEELAACEPLLAESEQRRATTEDLMWALMNTPEFIFKD